MVTRERQRGRLTDDEVDVLALAAQGLTVEATARVLNLPPGTVALRLGRARRQLGACNTTAAVATAIRQKVIP